MARSHEYNFGLQVGIDEYSIELIDEIVQNLDNTDAALRVLEESRIDHHERWMILSNLVRDKPWCRRLFSLRYVYVQRLKALPQDELWRCWSRIECRLNDEERRLWKVEDTDLDSFHKMALSLVFVICASFVMYSKIRLLGDEPGYVILGISLICIVLLALIALANYCFQRLKRRQMMETVGLPDLV